jgi:hypothetical protein
MSPKTMTALRLDPDVLDAMRAYKAEHGVPMTIQIEKAVTDWLSKKGVVVKKAPSLNWMSKKGVVKEAASRRARTRRKASKRQQL